MNIAGYLAREVTGDAVLLAAQCLGRLRDVELAAYERTVQCEIQRLFKPTRTIKRYRLRLLSALVSFIDLPSTTPNFFGIAHRTLENICIHGGSAKFVRL